jgi:type I restriction enzyme M protein
MTPRGGIMPHNRFPIQAKRLEVLFVDYITEHLTPNGKAGIIVPEGIIFQSGNVYKQLRKMLVEDGLWAVISLPQGVFNPYAGVKTSILFFNNTIARQTKEILFIKVENDGYDLGAQRRPIDKNDLPTRLALLNKYKKAVQEKNDFLLNKDEEKFASVVKKEKIAESGEYNLSANNYLIATNYSDVKLSVVKLGEVIEFLQKSKRKAGDGMEIGMYPFYTSSQIQDKWLDIVDYKEEALILGTGGMASIHISNDFSTSADVFVVKGVVEKLNNKFLYYYLKNNLDVLKAGFRGAGLKHLSKEYLKEIQIPLPPIEVQKEIVKEFDGYQNIIDGAKQVVDNYKPTIKIDPKWEKVKLGEIFKLSSGNGLTQRNIIKGEHPVYGGNGINGYHNNYFLEDPTIVIGRVGEYCGVVHITESKSWVTDNGLYVVKYLRPVDNKYLAIVLGALDINRYAKTGGQPSVSQSTIYELVISLPSIEIQKQIVAKIEEEQKIIEANGGLIKLFEQKIKDKISEVWGE